MAASRAHRHRVPGSLRHHRPGRTRTARQERSTEDRRRTRPNSSRPSAEPRPGGTKRSAALPTPWARTSRPVALGVVAVGYCTSVRAEGGIVRTIGVLHRSAPVDHRECPAHVRSGLMPDSHSRRPHADSGKRIEEGADVLRAGHDGDDAF